jgi:hypothetical protein
MPDSMAFEMFIVILAVSGTWSSSNLLHGVGPTQLGGCVAIVDACILHADHQQDVIFINNRNCFLQWIFSCMTSGLFRKVPAIITSLEQKTKYSKIFWHLIKIDRLCGLVVRVLGYRSGGPCSIPGTIRKKSSGSGTGSTQPREYNWGATW